MANRYACTAIAAAVLTFAMASFAQTDVQKPTQTSAQAGGQRETPITLVGCVQREADYRREHSSGRGGALGTGAGLADEFVLVNASTITAAQGSTAASAPSGTAATSEPSGTETACKDTGTGEAYELTGSREGELKRFVGRRIEITGMLKHAETASGTTGTAGTGAAKPTGGFDPLRQDLRLPEVNVTSFREVAASRSPVPQASANTPPASGAGPEPQPDSRARRQDQLPRTASPLPLAGLIGLLSLGGALGIRSLVRHR